MSPRSSWADAGRAARRHQSAAKEMQRRGLIDYSRWKVTVLDPHGLKSVSCNCYKTDRQLYTTLLRDPRLDRNPQPKEARQTTHT